MADEIELELPRESRIADTELTDIGLLVRELVRDPGALAWLSGNVEQWAAEHVKQIEYRDRIERRLTEYVKRALRRPALQDQNRRPRKPVCVFHTSDWRGIGERWPGVPGIWVPDPLFWPAPLVLFPLPLPGGVSLGGSMTLSKKCAALAAVHDCTVRGGAEINPWDISELMRGGRRGMEAKAYQQLLKRVRNVPASDGPHLRAIVEDVRRALADANAAAAAARATADVAGEVDASAVWQEIMFQNAIEQLTQATEALHKVGSASEAVKLLNRDLATVAELAVLTGLDEHDVRNGLRAISSGDTHRVERASKNKPRRLYRVLAAWPLLCDSKAREAILRANRKKRN